MNRSCLERCCDGVEESEVGHHRGEVDGHRGQVNLSELPADRLQPEKKLKNTVKK